LWTTRELILFYIPGKTVGGNKKTAFRKNHYIESNETVPRKTNLFSLNNFFKNNINLKQLLFENQQVVLKTILLKTSLNGQIFLELTMVVIIQNQPSTETEHDCLLHL